MAKLGNLSPIFSEIYVERPDGTKVFKAYLAGEWVGSESLTEVRSPIDLETYAYVPRSNSRLHTFPPTINIMNGDIIPTVISTAKQAKFHKRYGLGD